MQHRSPGISQIYDKIAHSQSNHILDLGQVSASFFQLFSRQQCKIYYDSLHELVVKGLTQESYVLTEQLSRHLKAMRPKTYFDVVLSWDLFNYMPLPAIKVLLDAISQHCEADTLIHCIRYLGSSIPRQPAQFVLLDQHHLEIRADKLSQRKVRRYSSYEFSSVNPHFYFHFSQFNEAGTTGGIGEDILRYAPGKQAAERSLASSFRVTTTRAPHSATPTSMGYFSQNFSDYPVHHSPVLKALFTKLSGKKVRILDLGEKIASNMQMYQQHFHEIYSHNLLSSLHWQNSINKTEQALAKLQLGQQALDFGNIYFNIIILWDIFNFCSAPQRKLILQRLSKHCKPGSKLLVFSYTGNSRPLKPQKFYLGPPGRVHIAESVKGDKQQAALSGSEITKDVNFMTLKSTQILQPGMRPGIVELLFEYTPSP